MPITPALLVAERRHRDPPPLVHRPEQRRHGHAHVVEVHLGEVGLAVRLHDGAAGDAGEVERHEQGRDATVRRGVGVGAHEQHAVGRPEPDRRPHLGAVDHEVVAVELGPTTQPGEVAPRVGLAEPLAPHLVRAQDATEVHLLLGCTRGRRSSAPRCWCRTPRRAAGPSRGGTPCRRRSGLRRPARDHRSRPATPARSTPRAPNSRWNSTKPSHSSVSPQRSRWRGTISASTSRSSSFGRIGGRVVSAHREQEGDGRRAPPWPRPAAVAPIARGPRRRGAGRRRRTGP